MELSWEVMELVDRLVMEMEVTYEEGEKERKIDELIGWREMGLLSEREFDCRVDEICKYESRKLM